MLGPSRAGLARSGLAQDLPQAGGDCENDFFIYVFKVQPCPKRGAHDWSSCPYAHPKEKARRRDPRVYKYASTPCPESLKGVSCGRGVDCHYAHSVYEYWLHPSRFRTQARAARPPRRAVAGAARAARPRRRAHAAPTPTPPRPVRRAAQMCKKGNQCNRALCFFAHSASELRFPETGDDLEAAAVDAAAASATAGALPPAVCGAPAAVFTPASMLVPGLPGGYGALPSIMGLGQVCGDGGAAAHMAAAQLAAMGGAGYGMVPVGAPPPMLVRQDGSGAYALGGSDGSFAGVDPASLSDPLPRLGGDGMGAPSSAAWLQLAAASQLPVSQVMGAIQPPPAHAQSAQARGHALHAPNALALQQQARGAAAGLQCVNAGAGAGSPGAGADHLATSLAGMALVDDNSASSCLTSLSGDQQYLTVLAGGGGGSSLDLSSALTGGGVSSPVKASAGMDLLLLQQQLHAQQQAQLAKLGSGSMASTVASCGAAAGSRSSSGALSYHLVPPMQAPAAAGGWGVRMAASSMLGQAPRLRSHVSSAAGAASCSAAGQARALGRPRRVSVRCFQQHAPPAASAVGSINKVKLSFKLPYHCTFGQEVCLVGSGEALGNWSVENAKPMHWTDGDVWEVEFEVTTGPEVELEYKYVVRSTDGGVLCWKPGENCQIRVPVWLQEEKAIAEGVLVRDAWDGSLQDIELEVTGFTRAEFTEEEERAAVQSAVDRALHELSHAMTSSASVQTKKQDPTAPEVLQADRLVAAAARKAVAMHRAFEASKALQALPMPAGQEVAAEQPQQRPDAA
ncbi:zinc finger CCCH domain-containing protein 56 [Scenedesmus sp. PABB004]|nr:zinc finger CCCH domain-containing protein 56 [Scenedesmus sp. PABB004]